jgi:hypothetical protein
MAIDIRKDSLNSGSIQSGLGAPMHLAAIGTLFTDKSNGTIYINKDNFVNWTELGAGGGSSGSTLPTFTAGSIVFADASGLTQDNANLFWDNTNKRLGIGTPSPLGSSILDITSTSKGILIPRMTLTQRNEIASPAGGLQVIVTGETGGEFVSMYNSSTTAWIAMGSGIALSSLLSATSSNIIDNAANAQQWQWNTLRGGNGLTLSSGSSGATGNTQSLFNVSLTGTNSNAAQSTYAARITNNRNNTSGFANNFALYLSSTGSGGAGVTNHAMFVDAGAVVLNTNAQLSYGALSNANTDVFNGTRIVRNRGVQEWNNLTQSSVNFRWFVSNSSTDILRLQGTNQVGIGTSADVNASAILAVESTTRGLLMPRMTLTQRNAITSPAAGLQVVVTGETGGEFLSIYNSSGATWQNVSQWSNTGQNSQSGQIFTLSNNAAYQQFGSGGSIIGFIGAAGSLIPGSTTGFGIRTDNTITFGNGSRSHSAINVDGFVLADGSISGQGRTKAATAVVDFQSTTRGILIPRMTLTQRNAIASPAAGLQVIVTGEAGGEFVSMYNSSTASWVSSQQALTLTTTGSSGSSTFVGSILNVPTYTLAGLGGQSALSGTGFVKISGTSISYDNSVYYLASNPSGYTTNVGTVTSVGLTSTTIGLTISSSPINTSGNIALNIATASGSQNGLLSSTDWTTFNNKQAAGNYITALTGEVTATGPGSVTATLVNSAVIGKVLTGLNLSGGGTIASTDTILQAFGKTQNQISALVGGVMYEGTWNATTNSPTIASGTGSKGDYYVVSTSGSTNIDGITDWKIGDWIIFNGTVWDKVDNTDAVSSVNAYTGAVSLVTGDVLEGAGSLPSRPSQLYFTDARARAAISLTTIASSGSSSYNSSTGVLNVPTYTLSGLGGVPTTRSITINGTAFDLSADRSYSVGTVTSVAALTLGTTGTDLNSTVANGTTTPVITLNIPTASATNRGALSSTDWTTFNSKFTLPALTSGSVLFSNGTTIAQDNANFFWDDTNNRLGIGTNAPANTLDVSGSARVSGALTVLRVNTDGLANANNFSAAFNVFELRGTSSFGGTAYIYDGTNWRWREGTNTGFLRLGISRSVSINGIPWNSTGTLNISVGFGAGGTGAASSMTAVGDLALSSLTSGANNTSIGEASLFNVSTGANNTAIGRYAGTSSGGNSNANHSSSIFLGVGNGWLSGGTALTNTYIIGNDVRTNLSNVFMLGRSDQTIMVGQGTSVGSGAIFQIDATNRGLLIPRMTLAQRNAIASPAAGLQVIVTGEAGGEFVSMYNSSTASWVSSQQSLTLTTTGTSGSSTLVGGTLNIPTYTLAGLGGQVALSGTGFVKISGTSISYDNSSYYLASNPSGFTSNAGTVTSVAALTLGTSGTDLNSTVANGTTTPVITLNVPTASATNRGALSSSDWTTFNNKENAITTGTTLQYFRGDKTFQTLNTSVVPELTNLYYTEARVNANTNVAANTAARHNAVTIGTGNGLSLSTQVLSLGLASSSANGALSSSDWSAFNGKFTLPSLTSGSVLFSNGTTITQDNANFFWDDTNNRLGIGTNAPANTLDVNGSVKVTSLIINTSGQSRAITTFYGAGSDGNNIFIGGGGLSSGTGGGASSNGSYNTTIGVNALLNNTTGYQNTAVGYLALLNNTTGYENTALGFRALLNNSAGYLNTAVGNNTLLSNTTGYANVALGYNSLLNNTTGNNNMGIGYRALLNNAVGNFNVAIGLDTLLSNTSGSQNTAIGVNALLNNTTASDNIAIGISALFSNTIGYSNTSIGNGALRNNTTGHQNTANGYEVLFNNTTGHSNTAVGVQALYSNSTGLSNTALGYQAGFGTGTNSNTTGDNNIFIGNQSVGVSSTESNRTWIGNSSTVSTWLGGSLLLGTTTDAPSAILNISSVTRGLLIPRMTTVQKNAIASPATGLQVYDTSTNSLEFYNGTAWQSAEPALGNPPVSGYVLSSTSSGVRSWVAATGGGGSAYVVTGVSTTYTETATSGTKIIKGNTSSGAFTITLPTAVGNTATIIIKKTAGTPSLTVDGAGTETIDGGLTAVINRVYESITLVSDNTNWLII